jgi:hypothetical protein
MRQALQSQKPRQLYSQKALVKMVKAMSHGQIMEKTETSVGYLAQTLLAKGAGAKGKPPQAKISS